jgi:ankyrin repeat protein
VRDYKKVKFHLWCGEDATVIGQDGITPVHLALIQGEIIDEIIAKMLLASRPTSSISEILQGSLSLDGLFLYNLNNRDNRDSVDVMKFILELSADVNIINSERETPLMRAAHRGDLKAINSLLKQENINLYAKDRYWQTTLHIAT